MRRIHAVAGAVLAAMCAGGWAATVVAGPATCSAAATHPFYPTIQNAIDSVPAGSTVLVCPGTYPEQVSIAKNLTLQGVPDTNTNANQAVIAIPPGALNTVADVGGGGPIAPQVFVSGGVSAVISNVTVDGSGNGISDCATDLVGVLYQNASGSLKNSQIINQFNPPGLEGCQTGLAVFVQTDGAHPAVVDIANNRVANFDKNGITADGFGVIATIENNSVAGTGATPLIAQNGIQLSDGAQGSITGNDVSDSIYTGPTYGSSGILVYASAGIAVTNNTVTNTQYAVAIAGDGNGDADSATVVGNRISQTRTFDAIDLCGSSHNIVQKNTLRGSDEAGIHAEGATFCGTPSTNNTVAKNVINGACAGVLVGTGAQAGGGKNTFYNTVTQTLTGSDVCPAGPAAARAGAQATAHRVASPWKAKPVHRAG